MITALTDQTDETDRYEVVLMVSEIESMREILTTLDDVDARVHPETFDVRRPHGSSVELDLEAVTAKQRQALELAHERGYYDRPRETDLSELAAELGISKSAVSQRLRAAEATIVDAVVTAME